MKPTRSLWGISIARLLGLIMTPLLIVGVFLWGLWDPPARLSDVKAAVVNLDEPVTIDGQYTPLGRVLAAELIGQTSSQNFSWELTNEEGAQAGLSSGEFVTVVTIPQNFSAAATSLSGGPDKAEQATIEVQTSEKAKLLDPALSSAVTQIATQVLNEQLGSAFVGNIFVGMNQLGGGLDQVQAGSSELTAGLQQLAAGLGLLNANSGELTSGAAQLATGATQLSGGLSEASAGAGQLAGGTNTFADGVGEYAQGVDDFSIGLYQYAAGANQFAGGMNDLASGASDLAAGVGLYTDSLNGALIPINDFLQQIVPDLVNFKTQLQNGEIPISQELTDQLISLIDQILLAPGYLDQAITGGTQLAEGSTELAYGASELAAAANGLAGGADGLAGGSTELLDGANGLAGGARELAGGSGELAAGLQQISVGASQLATGTSTFANSLPELAAGIAQLTTGAGEAAGGSQELTGGIGQIAAEVPRYTDEQAAKFGQVAVAPVASATDASLFNGSGAPLFATIALWAGALAAFLLLRPLWPRTREAALSEAAITLKSTVPAMVLGAVQGSLVGFGVGIALKLGAPELTAYVLGTTVAGATFMVINQALVALLGGIGRFIALTVLVVTFVAGIISTAPAALSFIADMTPAGQAIRVMAAALTPGAGLAAPILGLLVWAAAGFVLVGWAVHRKRA